MPERQKLISAAAAVRLKNGRRLQSTTEQRDEIRNSDLSPTDGVYDIRLRPTQIDDSLKLGGRVCL